MTTADPISTLLQHARAAAENLGDIEGGVLDRLQLVPRSEFEKLQTEVRNLQQTVERLEAKLQERSPPATSRE